MYFVIFFRTNKSASLKMSSIVFWAVLRNDKCKHGGCWQRDEGDYSCFVSIMNTSTHAHTPTHCVILRHHWSHPECSGSTWPESQWSHFPPPPPWKMNEWKCEKYRIKQGYLIIIYYVLCRMIIYRKRFINDGLSTLLKAWYSFPN